MHTVYFYIQLPISYSSDANFVSVYNHKLLLISLFVKYMWNSLSDPHLSKENRHHRTITDIIWMVAHNVEVAYYWVLWWYCAFY